MKKKGKSFQATPAYKAGVPPKHKVEYSRPPGWFKILRHFFLALITVICIAAIAARVRHWYRHHFKTTTGTIKK